MTTMQFAVASNQMKCKRDALSFVAQDTTWTDQRVTATIKALPTVQYSSVGLIARANLAGDTMYFLQLVKDAGCFLQLYAVYGGTYNMIWAQTDPGAGHSTVDVGHTLTLDVTGTTITAAVDGMYHFQGTNALIATGTYAGVEMDSTVPRIDDWSVVKSTALASLPIDPPFALPFTDSYAGTLDAAYAVPDASTWGTSGGVLQASALDSGRAIILLDPGSTEVDILATINSNSVTTSHGLIWNYLDSSNYTFYDASTKTVYTVIAGTTTSRQSFESAPVTGVTRMISTHGMVFMVGGEDQARPALRVAAGIPDTGGTKFGFFTTNTAVTFDTLNARQLAHYESLGTLAASSGTRSTIGTQRMAQVWHITTTATTPGQGWHVITSSWDGPDSWGVFYQLADNNNATDYPQEQWNGGSTGSGYGNFHSPVNNESFCQFTYKQAWCVWNDSANTPATFANSHLHSQAINHAEAYSNTNGVVSDFNIGRGALDGCAVFGFAE